MRRIVSIGRGLAILAFAAILAFGAALAAPVSRAARVAAHPPRATSTRAAMRVAARYQGTLWLEAHFHRPGEAHAYHSEQRVVRDPSGRIRLEWWTWTDDDTARVPESFLLDGARLLHRDAPDAPWTLVAGDDRRMPRRMVLAFDPERLLRESRALHAPHLELALDHGQLQRLVDLHAHPRLGDVRDSVALGYASGEALPDSIGLTVHDRGSMWRLSQRRVPWNAGPPADSLLALPAVVDTAQPRAATWTAPPVLVQLAPGVWAAEMVDIGSRTLIVEFADHLAVIEVAVGSANGERIVDAARRKWPGKPIRYALFSHYHPYYAGGLRALIAEGATVITTPGNDAFVQQIAALPFTLEPDRLARAPRPTRVISFAERFELSDSTNRLEVFNYGARSNHTDEFAMFWLPRARLLFESELGWSGTVAQPRASSRAPALLAWIREQKLDVDRIVQSWPMRDVAPEMSSAALDSLARAIQR